MLGIIILHGSANPGPIYELYQVESKPVCTGLMLIMTGLQNVTLWLYQFTDVGRGSPLCSPEKHITWLW
jgi:hypothetical protein